MAWDEEDDDVYSSVGSALADPAGTYAGENSAVPDETPKIQDGAPSTVKNQQQEDPNKADDEEVNYIAGNSQGPAGRQQDTELADAQPEDERSGISTPPDNGAVSGPTDDEGDQETAALAGTQTYKAPPPLVYKPYEDHSADYAAMTAQKANENPANYKPSVGRRIAAGFAAGLTAAGTRNAGEGMAVGKEVLSGPLDRAKQQWAAQEAPLQSKIEADKAADQAVDRENTQATNQYNAAERNLTNQAHVDSWNAMAQQRRAQAEQKLNTVDKNTMRPVDPNNPFGEWQASTPKGEIVRGLEPPASIQKDPRFISQQRRQQLSDMAKQGVKLTPQEEKYFLINGKLAEPTERTSINIRENPDGSAVQPGAGRGHGSGQMSKSLQDRIIAQKNGAMAKAQQSHAAGQMSDEEYQSALQDAQDNYEQRIEEVTGQKQQHVTVGNDFSFNSGGQKLPPSNPQQGQQQPPAQQQAQQQPAQQQQPGKMVIQNGGGQKLTDVNLAKQYLAKAGGDKQKARQLAAQDNWKF